MVNNITNFILTLQLNNGECKSYTTYCISGRFYLEIENSLPLLFDNKKVFKQFINKIYKYYYYNNKIEYYSFQFCEEMMLYENEYMSSKQFNSLLNDFIGFITNINTEMNEKITKYVMIKYTKNDLVNNIPEEIIQKILKLLFI